MPEYTEQEINNASPDILKAMALNCNVSIYHITDKLIRAKQVGADIWSSMRLVGDEDEALRQCLIFVSRGGIKCG